VDDGIEGLVHVSELSDHRINHPKEVVKEGDTLQLRVIKIDSARRRLGLSLKRVNDAEYAAYDQTEGEQWTEAETESNEEESGSDEMQG
jgi:small subunit ribosomal protein S1